LTKGDDKAEIMNTLIALSRHDSISAVRAAALKCLARNYEDESLLSVYDKAASDSSYEVMGEAIKNYMNAAKKNSFQWLRQFENEKNGRIINIIAGIYSEKGTDENKDYFINALKNAGGLEKYELVSHYSKFLKRCNAITMEEGAGVLEEIARNGTVWWVRMSGTQALADLMKTCDERSASIKKEIADATAAAKSRTEIQALEMEIKKFDELRENIRLKMIDIKKNETDKNLKKLYDGIGN
jgi:glutamyl-tRNA reductase